MERHPSNLFYSDEVTVDSGAHGRSGILVICKGVAYFISKDDENLQRGSRIGLARALLVAPFCILDNVEKVLLPI